MKKNKKKFKKPVIKTRKKSFIFKFHHQNLFSINCPNSPHPVPKHFMIVFICCFVPCLKMDIEEAKKKNTQKVTLNYDSGVERLFWYLHAHTPPVASIHLTQPHNIR